MVDGAALDRALGRLEVAAAVAVLVADIGARVRDVGVRLVGDFGADGGGGTAWESACCGGALDGGEFALVWGRADGGGFAACVGWRVSFVSRI